MQTNPEQRAARSGQQQYRDGHYRARGWYGTHLAFQDVIMVLEEGVIAAVGVTTPAADTISLGYQQRFAAALPAAVWGAHLDEVNVDRIAGASGCTEGFLDALAKIRQSAREQ